MLLQRLVGLSGMMLEWFRLYPSLWPEFFISLGDFSSEKRHNNTTDTKALLRSSLFCFEFHSHADDTQVCISVSPHDFSPIHWLVCCLYNINICMSHTPPGEKPWVWTFEAHVRNATKRLFYHLRNIARAFLSQANREKYCMLDYRSAVLVSGWGCKQGQETQDVTKKICRLTQTTSQTQNTKQRQCLEC